MTQPSPELLSFLQTIVLTATAVVVGWYTVETMKIRKETQRQNTLLAEQLQLLRQSAALEFERESALSAPDFKAAGGRYSGAGGRFDFINVGAPIRHVRLLEDPNDLGAETGSCPYLPTDKLLRVKIKRGPSDGETFSIVIGYSDMLDRPCATRLIRHSSGVWESLDESQDHQPKDGA